MYICIYVYMYICICSFINAGLSLWVNEISSWVRMNKVDPRKVAQLL